MLWLFTQLQTQSTRFKNEDGATAIEYGLMAALIAVVIIAAVRAIGVNLSDTFTKVANAVKSS